jgi:hypothetical protein
VQKEESYLASNLALAFVKLSAKLRSTVTFVRDKDTEEDFEGLRTKLHKDEDDDSLLEGEDIGETATEGLSVIIVLCLG